MARLPLVLFKHQWQAIHFPGSQGGQCLRIVGVELVVFWHRIFPHSQALKLLLNIVLASCRTMTGDQDLIV